MKLQDYINYLERKKAQEDLSLICVKQKHEDIKKKVSDMIGGLKNA